MNGVWVLRFGQQSTTTDRSRPVVVVQVAPDGEETEFERLFVELGSRSLRDVVKDEIAKGRKSLVLDLRAISHLGSSEIGQIVSAFVHAGRADASLVLACVQPSARKVIRVMGLERVIPIFESVAAAAQHFDS